MEIEFQGRQRKQVRQACQNCKKRKKGCDSQRPCGRCVRLGLAHTCSNADAPAYFDEAVAPASDGNFYGVSRAPQQQQQGYSYSHAFTTPKQEPSYQYTNTSASTSSTSTTSFPNPFHFNPPPTAAYMAPLQQQHQDLTGGDAYGDNDHLTSSQAIKALLYMPQIAASFPKQQQHNATAPQNTTQNTLPSVSSISPNTPQKQQSVPPPPFILPNVRDLMRTVKIEFGDTPIPFAAAAPTAVSTASGGTSVVGAVRPLAVAPCSCGGHYHKKARTDQPSNQPPAVGGDLEQENARLRAEVSALRAKQSEMEARLKELQESAAVTAPAPPTVEGAGAPGATIKVEMSDEVEVDQEVDQEDDGVCETPSTSDVSLATSPQQQTQQMVQQQQQGPCCVPFSNLRALASALIVYCGKPICIREVHTMATVYCNQTYADFIGAPLADLLAGAVTPDQYLVPTAFQPFDAIARILADPSVLRVEQKMIYRRVNGDTVIGTIESFICRDANSGVGLLYATIVKDAVSATEDMLENFEPTVRRVDGPIVVHKEAVPPATPEEDEEDLTESNAH